MEITHNDMIKICSNKDRGPDCESIFYRFQKGSALGGYSIILYVFCSGCSESLWTEWMVWRQPPSSLCIVDYVEITDYQKFYYICSGVCKDQQGCVGKGDKVGTRFLTCEGVDGECCTEIW